MYGVWQVTSRGPRSEKPEWARAFKARREEIGLSQEELALRADVSQSLVSQIERGVQKLTGIATDRLIRLAAILNWTLPELQRGTGVDLGIPMPDEDTEPASGDLKKWRGAPIPPVVDYIKLPLVIPPALQEMIDEHSGKYSELKNEVTVRALSAPRLFAGHSQGPQTADQWFEYFLMNRRWLPK